MKDFCLEPSMGLRVVEAAGTITAELISCGRLLLADGLGAEFGPYDCLEICCPKFPMDLRLGEIPVGIITAGLIDCLREYCELLREYCELLRNCLGSFCSIFSVALCLVEILVLIISAEILDLLREYCNLLLRINWRTVLR
jgi:hypothetical protein